MFPVDLIGQGIHTDGMVKFWNFFNWGIKIIIWKYWFQTFSKWPVQSHAWNEMTKLMAWLMLFITLLTKNRYVSNSKLNNNCTRIKHWDDKKLYNAKVIYRKLLAGDFVWWYDNKCYHRWDDSTLHQINNGWIFSVTNYVPNPDVKQITNRTILLLMGPGKIYLSRLSGKLLFSGSLFERRNDQFQPIITNGDARGKKASGKRNFCFVKYF